MWGRENIGSIICPNKPANLSIYLFSLLRILFPHSLSFSLFLSLSIYLSIYLSISFHFYVFFFLTHSVFVYVSLSHPFPVYLCIYLSIYFIDLYSWIGNSIFSLHQLQCLWTLYSKKNLKFFIPFSTTLL